VIVAIAVVVAVIVMLIAVMRWADKRDRARGHVNRSMGDIRSTIRANRVNMRTLRSRGGGSRAAMSPHEFQNKQDRFRRR
jgi:Flp pilus assembly protein TadB